mgnify:CR=1 FL=1
MLFGLLVILFLNGIISFANNVKTTKDITGLWALFSVNYIFFLSISQTGIVFSAIMRVVKSEWGRYFSRLGEILTLSFIPVGVVTFVILYGHGIDYLFHWASNHPSFIDDNDLSLSPWMGKGSFLWRHIITMALFYVASYIYFRTGRIEEQGMRVPYDIKKRLNILASIVIVSFVLVNTTIAWDFGMVIVPHWESSLFPPYFWVGNIYAGAAFLLIVALIFSGTRIEKEYLSSMGKLLLGYAMLWIYMFWSQHIVIWYEDLPNLTEPLYKQMRGNYRSAFYLMIVTAFILPFMALIQRRIRFDVKKMIVVASIICIGIWTNRYLMIFPVFSDGSIPIVPTWIGISLILAFLAAVLLSIILFLRFFPDIIVIRK